jgi:hypothetical protein
MNDICGICKNMCIIPTIIKCKHIYCYLCIKEWYITINNFSNNYHLYRRECPYCREDGGYIPLQENELPIYNIHVEAINNICNGITLKGTKCTYNCKYNGYCNLHSKIKK